MFKLKHNTVKRIFPLLVILTMLIGWQVRAQNFGTTEDTSEGMIRIPPLQMLIDSAKQYSPLLKTKDIEITIREMEWRAQRWEWTDFIQPFTEYRYGTVDNYILGQQPGTVLQFQQTAAHRFNAGARINLTIFKAINSRSKLKLAEKRIELDYARRDEIDLLISKEVVRLWNMLKTYQNIIALKADLRVTQAWNLAAAKLLYESGEVPIMELARITEIASKADENHELAIKEFREAFFLLSELVGKSDIFTWSLN